MNSIEMIIIANTLGMFPIAGIIVHRLKKMSDNPFQKDDHIGYLFIFNKIRKYKKIC